MHSISSHTIFDYVKELCLKKYGGRLTGTEGYNASARWVALHLKKWGVKPAGAKGTYFQDFPNPYTLVFPGSEVILHIPFKKKSMLEKHYRYEVDFMPGSTSDTGEVTAEVVYVGYGITAPELKFDEYKGLDVKGKIVLMEREVPVSPGKKPKEFKKWRPYSFHQYKVKNAAAHGAAGMIYNYHIANPNCLFIKGLVLTYVGKTIVADIFAGTGRNHKKTKEKIQKKRFPQSFKTGKKLTIKNFTEHHPEGVARNVLGYFPGSHPELKKEAVVLGAHLDHLGFNHEMMPGADDNASGVAVIMAVAEAISNSPLKPKRSIVFVFFGAEEQGVKGSEYYLKHPFFPIEKTKALINLDGVGRGTKLKATAGKNYPDLWKYFADANSKYIHRTITPSFFHNLARPRLDAAHFMWAGIPSLSFSASGAKSLPYATYHRTTDTPDIITPEIMEDMAKLVFLVFMKM
ncbi:MAG: M20/M25/M40 family metallo-hydrolase [Candidatus Aminicenantes bacterium]|nr:M20/M25/M40 family metallo-hydrolase [Candidatus Aminicenantes bacterium]